MTTMLPLRRFARIVNGGTPSTDQRNWGGDVQWATPVDLARVDGGYLTHTGRSLTSIGLQQGSASVPPGSILISSRAPIGYTTINRSTMAFNQGCRGLVPMPGVDARFVRYWLSAQRDVLQAAGSGSTFMELSGDALMRFHVPSRPSENQRRIADFLDDQVARIDNVIAARHIQIGLIEEGLQGRIDRTTSCGDRRRLAPLLELLRDGTHTPPPRVDLGVPLLTAKNVKYHRLAFTAMDTAISQADADLLDRSFVPGSGDVLLSVKGSVGNVAVVPEGYPRFQVERNLAVLRPARQVLASEWLYWCLRGRRVQDQLRLVMGFSAQPGVYLGDLASLIIAVPSIEAQASQAATLDAFRDSTVSAATACELSIDLLSELQRSLITAAVTGEFDVSSADGSRVTV